MGSGRPADRGADGRSMSLDVPRATPREADDRPQGAVPLDVRENDERQAGHTPDAEHLPMPQLTSDTLPTGRPV